LNWALSSLIAGHVLPSSSARRTQLNVLKVILLYPCAVLVPFQDCCLLETKVTSMEVTANAVRRKGHRVVTGEKARISVFQVGSSLHFPESAV
jgi:hypothetical protein